MMVTKQDYPDIFPEDFDLDDGFAPQLQPQLQHLPQTVQPYDLGINSFSNPFPQFNGMYPSPQTPNFPIDHRMYSAGSLSAGPYSAGPYSGGSAYSAGSEYTHQEPTFDSVDHGTINQPMPFTPQAAAPYGMSFGSFPDTPDTSPTLQQHAQKSHYQAPATATTKKICEVDDISSPEDTPLIKRRTRARETCNNCRKEHRACDSKKPRCSRCEMYSKGSCCYDRVPKRRGRKPRPTKPLPDHILGAVLRSNPQLEYAIVHELQNGVQPDADDGTGAGVRNCDYLERDDGRAGLLDFFKASAVYKLVYGDDDEKAEVGASAAIFGAHLDSTAPGQQQQQQPHHQSQHQPEAQYQHQAFGPLPI
ncbi:hypothetical protein GGR53DRAFT_462448 [Hypoxylon sp. FL1150]|nr:hypothetical protein GGR53DRAFT_462448 [Hypoxylon sp. FL1150]